MPGVDELEQELVAVSPRHAVRLDPEYVAFIKRAPSADFVVRTIVRREANGLLLMTADIVIAGAETRSRYPLTARYPLHFRKVYYPGRLHGDPQDEFDRQSEAAAVLGIPPPLGHSPMTFRTCLIPGEPYSRLSPFAPQGDESNLKMARKLALPAASGLWSLAQKAFEHLQALHGAGLAHGDAELHNFVVSPSPLDTIPIDFEASVRKEALSEEAWSNRCRADLEPILREAVFLQCALGPQVGPLAELAWKAIDRLFRDPKRLRDEIGRQLDLRT